MPARLSLLRFASGTGRPRFATWAAVAERDLVPLSCLKLIKDGKRYAPWRALGIRPPDNLSSRRTTLR